MATRKKRERATQIGAERIPSTEVRGFDLQVEGRRLQRESRKRGGTAGESTRRIRLRQAREGTQKVIAGTIAANRAVAARQPASPEEKRNGSITPSTQPQATNGNGQTPASLAAQNKTALVQRSPREIKKKDEKE